MKIAFVVRSYSKIGGVSRYVANLAEQYVREGHEITVFCDEKPSELEGEAKGIHFVPVQVPQRPVTLRATMFPRKASAAARQGNFDVIHGQGNDCHGADVITSHSCHKFAMHRLRRMGTTRDRLKKWLNPVHPFVFVNEAFNYSEKGCREIIVLSTKIRDEIAESHGVDPARMTVIPTPVDAETFHPRNRERWRAPIRKELGIGAEPLVLFVGYEFERKGLPTLIEALARAKETRAKLVVVGKPENAFIRGVIRKSGIEESRVLFTGRVPNVQAYYAAADLYAFPTLYEANSLVLNEAFASALATLTTRGVGAADDYITDGENGSLIDNPLDVAEVCEKLDILLGDEELRRRYGAAARKKIEAFTTEEIARRTMEVFQRAAR